MELSGHIDYGTFCLQLQMMEYVTGIIQKAAAHTDPDSDEGKLAENQKYHPHH